MPQPESSGTCAFRRSAASTLSLPAVVFFSSLTQSNTLAWGLKRKGPFFETVEAEGFGKVRMFCNPGRSYIQMWNEDEGTWKPCLFGTSGQNHRLKIEYVWGQLLGDKQSMASMEKFKLFFASGSLSVVNGEVVEINTGDWDAEFSIRDADSATDMD